MNGLIRASLRNPYAVTVVVLTIIILGVIAVRSIPIDILPVFKSPAVQVLTFYGGMPAESVEKDITSRMERWTGQAAGTARQESRSIVGASIVRNYYRSDTDPNGALTQVNSLASAAIPSLAAGHVAAGDPAVRSDQLRRRSAWWRWTARRNPNRSFTTPGGTKSATSSWRCRAPWRRWCTAARSAR